MPDATDMAHPGDVSGVSTKSVAGFATPWARFWSKLLDLAIWQLIIGFTLGIALPNLVSLPIFSGTNGSWFLAFLTLPFAMALDSAVQGFFGNTLGRFIAGIKLEMIDHSKPSISVCRRRNFLIYIHGILLGVPLLSFISLKNSFDKLKSGQFVLWDRELYTRVYDHSGNIWRTTITAILYICAQIFPFIIVALVGREAV